MTRFRLPWSRRRAAAVAATGVLAVVAAGLVAPTGAGAIGATGGPDVTQLGLNDAPVGLEDFDGRTGSVAPTSAQLSAVRALGANARWNQFGTPQSLIKYGGFLATGLSTTDAVAAARSFLTSKAGLFRLTTAQVAALELVNDSRMAQSNGHAVLFRQKFGQLPAAVDGIVTVGVVSGKVAFVSSSIAPTSATPPSPSLSATAAWQKAAANVGRTVASSAISNVHPDARSGFTVFKVTGFAQDQQVRLRALPTYSGAVRPVYEANVVDVQGANTLAYTSYVDASTGGVLVRYNQVDNSMYNEAFTGTITAAAMCAPRNGPFTVDVKTKSIVVSASAALATNDIVLNLIGPTGQQVASSDTATSPEAITYAPSTGVPAGNYFVEVCKFGPNPTVPFTQPGNYAGTFSASDQAATASVPYPPKWKYFLSNPVLNFSTSNTTDSRKVGCWVTKFGGNTVPDCDNPPSPLINLAARGPWDYNFRTNTPTFTTEGNAATTAEAWGSPLTPGGANQRPVSQNREYGLTNPGQNFTDAWNNTKCSPTAFTAANNNNDILASVTSLFSNHNRVHDWSYFLGFTEANYNLQDSNFGNRASGGISPTGGEGDPEVGNVQAGALTGGQPTFMGRDNANQITLQDGIAPITNQYLFQPIAGAFYAPCVDGDYDMTVVGHEYNHAISTRMIGGPDGGITKFQGRSMGESWGDQVALEYLFEHNYPTGAGNKADGTPKLVEGPYVTGNKVTGIRNYALDVNPLQYGDLGYDITGPEVHADGEPWSAVMIDVRQAFINKYNSTYRVTDAALQRRCAQGDQSSDNPQPPLPAQFCPGNRRWMQLLFDAYLLQPSDTGMLIARDAMLAADVMRFNGANQAIMWNAFAKRGFGQFADQASDGRGSDSDQPLPDYTSPFLNEATLRIAAEDFSPGANRAPVKGTLYLGQYEARVTPVADTDQASSLSNQVKLVPGTYQFLFQAPGFGARRFSVTVGAGQIVDRVLHLSKNLASITNGASATGSSADALNPNKLIDDTENTNTLVQNQKLGVDVTKPFYTVDLAGTAPVPVRSIQVSALLRPAPTQDEDEQQPDMSAQNRFTSLRQFAISTCTSSATSNCSSPLAADVPGSPYTTIYDTTKAFPSPGAAFDSTLPRPLVPDLNLRAFDVPDTSATHVRITVLENQCSGTPEYAGEQDNDPANNTDCKTASARDESVRIAELQVFSFDSSTAPPGDPVVVTTMTAPATATAGSNVTYNISYTNLGPMPSANATITDFLPAGLSFVSATNGGTYNATSKTVKWNLGTVAVNYTGSVSLTAKIAAGTPVGTAILNQAQFAGALTFSPPAAATTLVVP